MASVTDKSGDVARAERDGGRITEVVVTRKGRPLAMLGPVGPEREYAFLPTPEAPPFSDQGALPVLIGSGAGYALSEIAARLERAFGPEFPLAVVDKEIDILETTDLKRAFSRYPGIRWIDAHTEEAAVKALTVWQEEHGGLPLLGLAHPFYLRLDRDFYAAVQRACETSGRADFWQRAHYAKFKGPSPRILLLTSTYFLMGEVIAACERLGFEHRFVQIPEGELAQGEFVEQLLTAVVEFKPDFAFTINHLGVDREGVLTGLLEKLRLPLASWFVDNPHLILSLYAGLVSPWAAIFTWDADNLESLSALGFQHVFYLPLGTDAHRFTPPTRRPSPAEARFLFPQLPSGWSGNISFVGNSMVSKIAARRNRSNLPPALLKDYAKVAAGFADGDERSVQGYLAAAHPHLLPHFDALAHISDRIGYETMLTWEATLQYRLACVRAVLPLSPLLVGDNGWFELLGRGDSWHYHPEMSYYSELPAFYPCSDVNFNCTSKQMKGAVNQRVFDVPATGSFLLTDYREQVENLFEPGSEIVCFHTPEEALELAKRYLAAPKDRERVARAARRRILAEHTYEHRVTALAERMRSVYG